MHAPDAPLPIPLGNSWLAFPEVQAACADAGVPLRDRYGWAFPAEWVVRAVKAARTGDRIADGVEALSQEIWARGLELCPTACDEPAAGEELLAVVTVLRSPVADGAAS